MKIPLAYTLTPLGGKILKYHLILELEKSGKNKERYRYAKKYGIRAGFAGVTATGLVTLAKEVVIDLVVLAKEVVKGSSKR